MLGQSADECHMAVAISLSAVAITVSLLEASPSVTSYLSLVVAYNIALAVVHASRDATVLQLTHNNCKERVVTHLY
eukprot:jgi/Chrzof1/9677/Cz04g11270.t1